MRPRNKISLIYKIATGRFSLINSIKVSLLVGIILNIINQGSAFSHFNFSRVNLVKFFLTFVVPFIVAIYSSTSTKLQFYVGDIAIVDGELKCISCKKSKTKIEKGNEIMECPNCKVRRDGDRIEAESQCTFSYFYF